MRIELDVHEYSVLIEAAWGAGTGLRMNIMRNAIDSWFHHLHPRDVATLHRFFSTRMKRTGIAEEEQRHFLLRYDPSNQYLVYTGATSHLCYKVDQEYHVGMNVRVDPAQVTHVRRLELDTDWLLEATVGRDLQVRNRKPPPCPACGEKHQVQLFNSLARPAEYRCRTCKHAFEHEP